MSWRSSTQSIGSSTWRALTPRLFGTPLSGNFVPQLPGSPSGAPLLGPGGRLGSTRLTRRRAGRACASR
eukprot:8024177-Pyramimonas_sp.AAC.1